MNEQQINKLVAEASAVQHDIVQAAIAKVEKERQEKKVAAMVQALDAIAENTKRAVRHLRSVREQEAESKKALVTLANAEAQFHKDADIAKYAKAVFGDTSSARHFVQSFQALVNG